ncbi:MAG: FtsX-like permease family protein [Magnetococcus sp. DMHC-6]
MKWLYLAARNVLRHQRRSLMAVTIVATGTAALLVALGYMLATFWGLREMTIRGELGHIQIGAPGQFDAVAETPLQYGLETDTVQKLQEHLKEMPGTKDVLQRLLFEGLISTGNTTVAFVGQGVEPEKEIRLAGTSLPLLSGTPLPLPTHPDQMQTLLAVDLARSLGVKPGDTVTLLSTTADGALNGIDVQVSGIYVTGVPEYDKRALLIPLPAARQLMKSERISRLVVVLKDTEATRSVQAEIAEKFSKIDTRQWLDLAPFYKKVVTLYHGIFTVMGVIILLVVLLSVTNTMLMSVMERVREMGTLMAFGFPRNRLRANFGLEGAIIGGIGGGIGLLVAAALAYGINALEWMMPAPPGRTMPVPLLIFVDGGLYTTIFFVMVALGGVAAWFPTRYIVRLNIVEALGHA